MKDLLDFFGPIKGSEINGMPLDDRIRPVKCFTGSGNLIHRICVISDGKGNAYDCENNPYKADKIRIRPENLIDPTTIKFDTGFSGQEL